MENKSQSIGQGQGANPSNTTEHDKKDREIRVFISSTFKDMHKERELLVKNVFPELRKICAERFVTFTEVDLRWGITEEQASEGKVLPICLEEINRCRPHFIGLLGERYGWIPDSIPQEVIEREPWLREHVDGRTSVTELEILHGVLNNPEMAGHSFFYFRDPAYIETVPEKEKQDYISEDEEHAEKLLNLKERIRQSGIPLVENYTNPDALADLIRNQFISLIDKLYPKEEVPDPLDQEAMGHESFGRGKLTDYVERPEHISAIDKFISSDPKGKGLVITGESGSGKTALLSSWVNHWRQNHPDDFVFVHYFGSTPDSASATGFLRRVLGELKRCYNISEEIPADPEKLKESLPLWIAHTIGKGRVLFILDGVNQIEGNDPERSLAWLPLYFPEHVRVIASALPGLALETLKEREWFEHKLSLVDMNERLFMIETYLAQYRKTLQTDLSKQIAEAKGSANPLFLKTILEELRQFGRFEQIPDRVAHYLKAQSPVELFQMVIKRWQEDYDNGKDLVRKSLSLLWAARHGLSETEWLEVLGTAGEAMLRQNWTPLFLAMESHLVQRSGVWAFGHDFLRQAVNIEFITSVEESKKAHLSLAEYFEGQQGITPRKAAEWPWQLHAAEEWGRLKICLTNRELFLALYNASTKWELTRYWHPLREQGVSLGESYKLAFDHWLEEDVIISEECYLANQVGLFLSENGSYPEAEPLYRHALEGYERVLGKGHPNTLTSLGGLAVLLMDKGDYAQAEPLLRRVLGGKERVLGKDHPDTLLSLNNLALLLNSKGEYAQAESLFRRALEVRERVLGKDHPDTLTSLGGLAGLLMSKGDYAQAEPLLRRVLGGKERVLGKDHPDTLASVNNLAGLHNSKGDYAQAEPLYCRALEGFERVLGKDHPDTLTSVNNLAESFNSKGDYAQAEPLCRRALEARERVLGKDHPDTLASVNNLAGLLKSKGDYAQAESLYRRAIEGSERVLGKDHPYTLTSVQNLAELLKRKLDHAQAESLFRRALEGFERVLGKDHLCTLSSVNSLAGMLKRKGDYAQAESLYRRALEGCERVLGKDHPGTLGSVNNLAELLKSKGDYVQAESLYRQALEGCEQVLGKNHPNTVTVRNNLESLLKQIKR